MPWLLASSRLPRGCPHLEPLPGSYTSAAVGNPFSFALWPKACAQALCCPHVSNSPSTFSVVATPLQSSSSLTRPSSMFSLSGSCPRTHGGCSPPTCSRGQGIWEGVGLDGPSLRDTLAMGLEPLG